MQSFWRGLSTAAVALVGCAGSAPEPSASSVPAAAGAPSAVPASSFSEPPPLQPAGAAGQGEAIDAPLAGRAGQGGAAGVVTRDAGTATDASRPPPGNGTSAPADVVPSPGCGRAGRPAGGVVTVDGDHIYAFPESYDGQTALPVVFGFHANNNPIDQIQNLTRGSRLASSYVMVFPKSAGSGWALGADAPRFEGWYRDVLDNYCVDESRVYATGHSSGAQFIVQLLCRGESRFKAVAPVASSMYCQSWEPIPALVIHGQNDMERARTNQDADGRRDLGPYLASNSCQMSSTAVPVAACLSGGAPVDPGCASFDGCSAPVIWCSHDDPSYANTNHGWPCFASEAMYDFFQNLP